MLLQMMEFLDVDGDGSVSKDEFKVPYMKMFPKMTESEFEDIWKKIDTNGDGDLQFEELCRYWGFEAGDELKQNKSSVVDMSDDAIMEALQMQAVLYDSRKELEDKKRRASMVAPEDGLTLRKRTTDAITKIVLSGNSDSDEFLLMSHCELGEKEKIKEYMDKDGINIRVEDDKGQMPLHKIARWGFSDVARHFMELLSKHDPSNACLRCDINKPDKMGKTPTFFAAEYVHENVVKLFLDHGCDPHVENSNGWTLLHTAVNANASAIVKMILEHRRVNAKRLAAHQDKSGRTPLHIAAFKCDEDIVALLLQYDANPKEVDSGGNDAIKLAAKTGRTKSKELLELHVGAVP
jgi:ankyrin repeat protein